MAGALTAAIASIFSGSAVTADPYFEYTTLLLPGSGTNGAQNNTFLDGSTNNFTITRNGNTTQGTFSPFSQTGWSGYFDGTTDFVSTPTGQTNLTLGTSDFTIEGWFYVGTQVQTNPALFTSDPGIGLANTIMIQFTSSTLNASLFVNNVHLTASSTNNYLVSNRWNHIAVCRTGGSTYSYYINGVAVDNVASNSTSLTTNSWRVGYWTVGANAFTGNISNFRIIKGTALYSGATITAPTAPLTAVTNTQLLILQDNRFIDRSPNNYTLTITGDVRVTPFSPFNPTASWSAATNGGSGYFDGSGDYLTVAYTTALQFTGNFTIEFWAYPNSTQVSAAGMFGNYSSWPSSTGVSMFAGHSAVSTTKWVVALFGTFPAITSTNDYVKNAWSHIALVRNGTGSNNITLYVNGVASGTFTSNNTVTGTANNWWISATGDSPTTQNFNGNICDFRAVGSAVYTTAFTPPTAPLTAITNTSLLLNFTNAGIYDATSKNDLETVGNAQISTAQYKFPPSSMAFDGTGDYLSAANISRGLEMLTGDFTIECWIRFNVVGNGQIVTGLAAANTLYWQYYSSQLAFGQNNVSSIAATNWSPSSGVWYHIAVTRSGSTVRQFVDGTQLGSNATSSASFANGPIQIGDGGAGGFNGYIQDLRITKGYARYTANFTAPTAAFPTL